MKNILTMDHGNIICSQYSNILTCVFRYRDTDWFVRVGDNYMASRDPSEQTFQVHMNRPPQSADFTLLKHQVVDPKLPPI